jgi:hypothetical protein
VAAVGSVWRAGVWSDIPWAAGTWADAQAPAAQAEQPAGGWNLDHLNPPRLIRVRDKDREEHEIEVKREEIPRLIQKIKESAETKAERKAAFRAAELLARTQPEIDLTATPLAQAFIARVMLAYLAEREAMRRAQQDNDALILLLM